MDSRTRELVRHRAGNACEYCHLPQAANPAISSTLSTPSPDSTAAWTIRLGLRPLPYKGPNLTSIDPVTGAVVPLYDPRADVWTEHFHFRGGTIVGVTPAGRATVRLLNMNAPRRVQLREEWLEEGRDL
ncbi:MAG: hypothetical protein WD069_20535 [Planctomycetales bacterium]